MEKYTRVNYNNISGDLMCEVLAALNDELVIEIVLHLSIKDILNLRRSNKRFKLITDNWKIKTNKLAKINLSIHENLYSEISQSDDWNGENLLIMKSDKLCHGKQVHIRITKTGQLCVETYYIDVMCEQIDKTKIEFDNIKTLNIKTFKVHDTGSFCPYVEIFVTHIECINDNINHIVYGCNYSSYLPVYIKNNTELYRCNTAYGKNEESVHFRIVKCPSRIFLAKIGDHECVIDWIQNNIVKKYTDHNI